MNILAIGAHPDDIEEGASGYLLKKQEQGHSIHHLVITDGSNRGDMTTRLNEQMDSNNILSPNSTHYLNYQDCHTEGKLQELIKNIEKIIITFAIDQLLTHYPGDSHHDHRITSQASLEAGRYVSSILFYESVTTKGFEPTHFCNISKYLQKKLDMMLCFKSQQEVIGVGQGAVKTLALYRGFNSKQGFMYAESFVAYRDILD